MNLVEELEAAIKNDDVQEPSLGDFIDANQELILRNACRDYALLCSPDNIQRLLKAYTLMREALEDCTGGDLASGDGIYKDEVARKALAQVDELMGKK